MPDSTQESNALSEILNRLKAMETKAEKFEMKVDDQFKAVNDQFKAVNDQFKAVNDQFKAVNDQFKAVDDHFKAVDDHFKAVDDHFKAVDDQFKAVNDQFKAVNDQFKAVDDHFKAVDDHFKVLDAKVDKHIEEVGYQFKLAAADRQAIRREMDNRFKEVDKRFEAVASASAMREGFMAAAADREAIRLEMREGFRIATERHEKRKTKMEENNAELIRIISDVGTITYQKIDANHQELKTFQKSMIEALESINQSLKRLAYLEGEIEELKKDKVIKDATIKRMEQRLAKLEAQINPA
jgi:chromosome segregation ATPase